MTTTARPALQAARHARGWSQTQAARELAGRARSAGGPSASPASLKSLLSRWENGHAAPEPHYRALLGELYGRTAGELGLAAPDPPEPAGSAERLRARLAAAAATDERLLGAWADQLEVARRLDDEVGAAGAAGLVRATVDELDRALVHTVDPRVRAAVASLLVAAATLAGWQALDLGDPERAWRHFQCARGAAAVADGEPGSLDAEATAGQAATLIDLGEPEAALRLLSYAPPASGPAAAWLAAAAGTALAARGRAAEARHRFDAAERALGPEPGGAERIAVRRGRAHALAALGEPDAASELETALAAGIASARERAATHAALAVALGPAPAAAAHASTARAIAERIGSTRAIALLAGPAADGAQSGRTAPISSSAAR